MSSKTKRFSKEEWSWIMYDWANSVYATIMMAAVFPIYFTNIAETAGQSGDYWWGIATSIAMVIVAVMAPIVGAFSDYIGYRKKIFSVFLIIGIGFTVFSAVVDDWVLLLLGYALSHIGFAGSCLIYDSFLPDVTTPDRMDKVSGWGFALGYIGGSTIPFLISIALIMFGESFGIDTTMAVKLSVGLCAVWWAVFTVPFLKDVEQKNGINRTKGEAIVEKTFKSIWQTAQKIYLNKKLFYFIIAYFFYIDGVGTVINMSTTYGATLGLDSTGMILALLVTQIVAFPCSIWFARLAEKLGSLKMLKFAIMEYLLICIVGFIMGFGLQEKWFGIGTATVLFWTLAVMVGTVQGGIQATSRSYYAQMVPADNSGEYFGFFDIFGKFASVMGPALYAFSKGVTGRSDIAILSIVLLFAVALIIMWIGRKHFKEEASSPGK